MNDQEYDIIVIGAGVAGGVFAASQDPAVNVLVIERDLSEQDRIVGELMQPDGIRALNDLGLSQLTEHIDSRKVMGYQLVHREEAFTINYSQIGDAVNGIGLRNGKFLNNIREILQQKENVTLVQGSVTDLVEHREKVVGVRYQQEGGEKTKATAPLTIVSDGSMSFFRKKLSQPNKKVTSYFMGLVLKDLPLAQPDLAHLIVSGDSPILVYPIQTNGYRILVDYPGEKPPRIGKQSLEKFKQIVGNHLPEEMLSAFDKALQEDQIKVMPNHQMKGQAFRKQGAILLGDALNMRHPITGGGMTACFNDIITLNKALSGIDLYRTQQVEKAVAWYYDNRSTHVGTINILANALYKVFRDSELKSACFEYLKKGGKNAAVPLSLLSGLNKDKKELIRHFFKIALQHPIHFITQPRKKWRLYKKAVRVMRPILEEEQQPSMV